MYIFFLLKVKMYAKVSNGYLYVTTNGGKGNKGQEGANGRKGTDDDSTVCGSENYNIYIIAFMYLLQAVSVSASV